MSGESISDPGAHEGPERRESGGEGDLPGLAGGAPASRTGGPRPRRPQVIDLTKWDTPDDAPAAPPEPTTAAPRATTSTPRTPGAQGSKFPTIHTPGTRSSVTPSPDFRRNVQRQVREQRTVGSFLAVAVTLIAIVLLAGLGFAGYGAYIVLQDLGAQKVSTTQMRSALRGDIEQIQTAQDKARKDLRIIQDALIDQQEDTARLADSVAFRLDKLQDAVNEERRARQAELLLLRRRASELESRVTQLER